MEVGLIDIIIVIVLLLVFTGHTEILKSLISIVGQLVYKFIALTYQTLKRGN